MKEKKERFDIKNPEERKAHERISFLLRDIKAEWEKPKKEVKGGNS